MTIEIENVVCEMAAILSRGRWVMNVDICLYFDVFKEFDYKRLNVM